MPELTVAQAYRLDPRFGWLWALGASRPVRHRAGVRFIGEPWRTNYGRTMRGQGVKWSDKFAEKPGEIPGKPLVRPRQVL